MKTSVLTIMLFFILVNMLYSQQAKTFTTGKTGALEMKVNYGDITINPVKGNEVIIRSNDEWGDDEISQDGEIIKIFSDDSKDFTISVPENFTLKISTSGGDITITGTLKGRATISTAAGSVHFNSIDGELKVNTGGGNIKGSVVNNNADINTVGGDISIDEVTGELTLNTAGGDISVKTVGKNSNINTAGGNITLGSLNEHSYISTGGGDVKINSAPAGIKVSTGGGNIQISDSKGKVSVSTGAGDVKVLNSGGEVKISTGFGNISADLAPSGTGTSKFSTGAGEILLQIPGDAKTTIRVITSEKHSDKVKVNSDFPLTTEDYRDNKKVSAYVLNGGGSNIEIRVDFGNIEIRKKK